LEKELSIIKKIPEGYKQTEIGVIPEDWDVKYLEEVSERVSVGLATSVTKYYRNKGVPIIRNLNIKDGFFDDGDMLYLDGNFAKANLSKSAKGLDVLTVHTGSNLGLTCVLPKSYDKCQTFTTLITTPRKWIMDPYYLCYHMSSFFGKKEMKKLEVGGGKGNLNTADLKKYRVFFPPTTEEQTAIATVLSDTDALIERLGKLIAKKKAIKQGAMQQLLTGKKRLPGFSGEWEVKKLPEVVWFQEGPGVRNSQFTNSGVKLLNGTNIEDGKLLLEKTDRYISEKEAFGWYSHFLVDDGDILIACSGVTIDKFQEKVTIASQVNLPLCMNTSTMRFKIVSSILSKDFFFYFLKSKSFKEQIGGKATGSAQLNFGPSHVKMVEIALPKPKEQTAIATILSDMDAEIESLEQKRDKYTMLKQGMMQQLLTGRIRIYANN